ncbi:MAG TPA: aminoacetone oxidase family FAD-binding enzyme, partial [Burkholderiaceae bacterium]|nr:aminoacetone oxidase family FAD-binding enzyme [Burkholderiaceae bacterium]
GRVERWQPCQVRSVTRIEPRAAAGSVAHDSAQGRAASWRIATDRGDVDAERVVIATGGLAVPKIGASDFGLRIAREWGHAIVEPRPALVPLVFEPSSWAPYAELAGVALEVGIEAGPPGRGGERGSRGERRPLGEFVEDLLFTHRGLSGPAMLQASGYWRPGEPISIALAPTRDWQETLAQAKRTSQRRLANEIGQYLPRRVADAWVARAGLPGERPLPEVADKALRELAQSLERWEVVPSGTEGWGKAEVMAGGVDTREIDSRTMESRRVSGLHFIGEVLDVTGWLGGYNFQWAWASAAACEI